LDLMSGKETAALEGTINMARVAVDQCETCGRARGEKHLAIKKRPTMAALERMVENSSATATDGCRNIEIDGHCRHGHNAWPLALGYV
jgi:hypothetical protein